MCGITGLLDLTSAALPTLQRMTAYLTNRGPDDGGSWRDDACGMTLGHRRLSIIDLSTAGHQPMASASQRYVLVYNGEIYNHADLRRELESAGSHVAWRGKSDTETLLAAFDTWGIEDALKRSNGMFAFACWDRQHRVLTLARDRMGEKPLYFGWIAKRFAFASELKAFTAVPGWHPQMHPSAISGFLRTGYVHGAESALAGIFRLPAGCVLNLSLDDMASPRDWAWLRSRTRAYWSLVNTATAGVSAPLRDIVAATTELEVLLRDAVALRMEADVPLGAFLSGGIDSSLVTALMQTQSTRPVRTFSIGFDETSHDEAPFARAVAKHLGTAHTELYVDAGAALDLIPSLAERFDEPFADFSQLPTLLVSKLARQSVTVALSGDGGDELFGGYSRYSAITQLWRWLRVLPKPVRFGMAATGRLAANLAAAFPMSNSPAGPLSFRIERLAERLITPDLEAMRMSFIGGAGHARITNKGDARTHRCQIPKAIVDPRQTLMFGDQSDYLPDDILFKVDRAAMAFGLETRIPLLDHRVVELSWRFTSTSLAGKRHGKLPLRHLLEQFVPHALVDRPKQGFSPPMDTWLRGPLRDWAETRLSEVSLRELPMLDAKAVRALWKAHCSGRMNAASTLWNVLMLANWRDHFGVSG
ncbi:asparagine synthase (glutamine-hydrolyzing) [Rhodanobacter sp. IGA1.0]|uniref:asparagine synthase (glutamine-hydrolyzing) n=1 Tax=Rhodanobacter sp. IGA1.0 TaxID=3158582 RepID=A0AAU7QPD2_9GAMM